MSHLPTSPGVSALYPFGTSEAFHRAARELDASVLGELPIVAGLSAGGDQGKPLIISSSVDAQEQAVRTSFQKVARLVWDKLKDGSS